MQIFKVGVLRTVGDPQFFIERTALEAYELTGDEIYRLLDIGNADSEGKGFVQSKLSVSPLRTYEITTGGRTGFYLSREDVVSTIQNVQVLILMSWMENWILYSALVEWVSYLVQEKLLDTCGMVIIRVYRHPVRKLGKNVPAVDRILHGCGIADGKMHLIVDPKNIHSKLGRKKKTATAQLMKDIDIVKSKLCIDIDDKMDDVIQPVNETVAAGKALLSGGHKLISWVGGLLKR